jgi:hypothetical protein
MRSKLLGVLLVMLIVLASFVPALAQDAPEVFCGDLSEDDCALLTAAAANEANMTSWKAVGEYSATIAGIPQAPEAMVDVIVDGSFALDEAAADAAAAVSGASQAELVAVLQESPEAAQALVDGLDADVVFNITLGEETAAALSAEAGVDIPTELSVPLVLKDGVLYVDPTEVKPLVQGLEGIDGWVGVEVSRLLEASIASGQFEAAIAQMDPANQSAAEGVDPATAALLAGLSDPKAFEKFMVIERGEDVEIDGASAAVFVTTFDVLSFLTSPEFTDIVTALADSGAIEGMTAADVNQAMGMVGLMGPMLFQGLTVEAAQAVDLDTEMQVAYSSTFSWDLASLLQMAAMSGQLPADMMSDTAMIDFSTSVLNSAINEPVEIAAPADALVIPAEAMMTQPE